VTRVPLLAYARYIDDPLLASHIVDLEQYYQDLADGTLPAVSYIVSAAASEHPSSSIQEGQRLVRSLVTELMRSSAWPNSAFILTYSNSGGWYDHVPPPRIDRDGYGFRVPALLVSPYARQGYIDSTPLDFTSILRFIEDNYDLEPLTARDAAAHSLTSAFDFEQPPRPARFVTSHRTSQVQSEPRRAGVYVAYSLALLLTAAIILWASLSTRRARRTQVILRGYEAEA
jgi:phospholipase C